MIRVGVAVDNDVKVRTSVNSAVNVETSDVHTTEKVVKDYNLLDNKPKINEVTVEGDKVSTDYGLFGPNNIAKNTDIDKLFK